MSKVDSTKHKPVGFREFLIGDLFEIKKIKGYDHDSFKKGSFPYVTRTVDNRGVSDYVEPLFDLEPMPKDTYSLGLLGMNFNFQGESWYAGQFIRYIQPKIKLNENLALYFEVVFNKMSKTLLQILIRDVDETFMNWKIQLPVLANNQPDYEYMDYFVEELKHKYVEELVAYQSLI